MFEYMTPEEQADFKESVRLFRHPSHARKSGEFYSAEKKDVHGSYDSYKNAFKKHMQDHFDIRLFDNGETASASQDSLSHRNKENTAKKSTDYKYINPNLQESDTYNGNNTDKTQNNSYCSNNHSAQVGDYSNSSDDPTKVNEDRIAWSEEYSIIDQIPRRRASFSKQDLHSRNGSAEKVMSNFAKEHASQIGNIDSQTILPNNHNSKSEIRQSDGNYDTAWPNSNIANEDSAIQSKILMENHVMNTEVEREMQNIEPTLVTDENNVHTTIKAMNTPNPATKYYAVRGPAAKNELENMENQMKEALETRKKYGGKAIEEGPFIDTRLATDSNELGGEKDPYFSGASKSSGEWAQHLQKQQKGTKEYEEGKDCNGPEENPNRTNINRKLMVFYGSLIIMVAIATLLVSSDYDKPIDVPEPSKPDNEK